MKKVILTFALLSLVVLTSFTTTQNQTELGTKSGDTGGNNTNGSSGGSMGTNKKLDYSFVEKKSTNTTAINENNNYNQILEMRKKSDI